ncbi:MAG TPA: serine/threonine-protein kinase [Polyangiaceae bacterium]
MELPKRVGRYDVVRLLGQGGMGRVLLAKDTVLGREVAVKIVRDDLGIPPEMKDALFARMKQEARAAAAVSHPNFVTLHDMGEEEPVGVFLVFEFVKGQTLRERIAAGALDPDDVYKIARDLGAALDRAHEAGVIHRDVKPENVLMSETGPKLTDFGIARLPDSTLTRAGSVLGTAAYSAPEALALAEFGPYSDQFSLAATLYEAFGGHRAFPGDDTLAVAARIATEDPAPLKGGSGEEMPRVGLVLGRALAKDPKKRFSSCTDLARALYNALYEQLEVIEPMPFSTRDIVTPPPSSSIIPPPPQRARVNQIMIACALLLIVGLVAFGRHGSNDDTEESTDREMASATASEAPTSSAKPPTHHAVRQTPAKPASTAKLPNVPPDSTDEPSTDEAAERADAGSSQMTPANAADASIHL